MFQSLQNSKQLIKDILCIGYLKETKGPSKRNHACEAIQRYSIRSYQVYHSGSSGNRRRRRIVFQLRKWRIETRASHRALSSDVITHVDTLYLILYAVPYMKLAFLSSAL